MAHVRKLQRKTSDEVLDGFDYEARYMKRYNEATNFNIASTKKDAKSPRRHKTRKPRAYPTKKSPIGT